MLSANTQQFKKPPIGQTTAPQTAKELHYSFNPEAANYAYRENMQEQTFTNTGERLVVQNKENMLTQPYYDAQHHPENSLFQPEELFDRQKDFA